MNPQKQSKRHSEHIEARWPGDEPEDMDFACGPTSVSSGPSSDEESTMSGDEDIAAELRALIAEQKAAEAKKAAGAKKAAEAKKTATKAKRAAEAKKAGEDEEATEGEEAGEDEEDGAATDDEDAADEAAADEEINGTGESRCICSSHMHMPPLRLTCTQGRKLR
jgi:hypothetical protein